MNTMVPNAKDGKNCNEALPLLEKLFDGEASAEEKRLVDSHLGECAACREHQVFLGRLSAVVKVAVLPEPSGSYWESLPFKVMARLDAPRRELRTSAFAWILAPARLGWAAGLVAASLALYIGLETFRTAPPAVDQALNAPPPAPLAGNQSSAAPAARPQVSRAEGGIEADRSSADVDVSKRALRPAMESVQPLRREAKEQAAPLPSEAQAATGAFAFSEPPAPPPASPSEAASGLVKQDLAKSEKPVALMDEKRKATLAAQEAVVDTPAAPAPVADEPARSDAYKGIGESEASTRYSTLVARYAHEAVQEGATVASGRAARLAGKDVATALAEECNDWRHFVRDFPQDPNVPLALFRLAGCSLRLYEADGTEANRKRAAEDGEAYLKVTSDKDEATEILGKMRRLRLKER